MNVDKYRTLLRAIDRGSFTKAAEELGYTPSGVVHMMNALESELGLVLMHRTRRGVGPTSDGTALMPSVRNLVKAADRLTRHVEELRGMSSGQIGIASLASIARSMLPEIISRYRELYPNIKIELFEGGGDEILSMVSERRAGMAFLTRQSTDRNFISLFSDEMLAAVAEGHPLAGRKEISVEELSEYPYIGVDASFDHDVRALQEMYPALLRPVLISRDQQAVLAMVREGMGFSIVAGTYINFASEGIVSIKLKPGYRRDVGVSIASREGLSAAEMKFLGTAKAVIRTMVDRGFAGRALVR